MSASYHTLVMEVQKALHSAKIILAVSAWFGFLFLISIWFLITCLLLCIVPVVGLGSLITVLLTLLVPIDVPCPSWISWFLRYSVQSYVEYLPVKVKCLGDIDRSGPYVIAYEPHSVLPQGMCIFSHIKKPASLSFPHALDGTAILVSNAIFWVPVLRHLWWWLGCRPVSRGSISRLLDEGCSVALCPGGVQECLIMQPYNESLYLKNRKGFIHLAMQKGASILPVFGFGQSNLYKYWRPFYDRPSSLLTKNLFTRLSRLLKFVPMVAWGYAGPVPFRNPLTIVIGKPIHVEKVPDIEIHDARVQDTLDRFINAMKEIYDHGRNEYGEGKPLAIY